MKIRFSPWMGATVVCAALVAACGGDSGPSAPDTTPAQVSVAPVGPVAFSALGDTARLVATVTNSAGEELSGVAVSWSSEDVNVARISASGLAEAVGTGSAQVRATAAGVESNKVTVTVNQAVAEVVIAGPASLTFSVGADTARLTASARDAGGAPIPALAVTWQSSAPQVATVDNSGLVRGVLRGAATITARANGVQSAVGVTANVVSPAAEIRITPSPNSSAALLELADFQEAVDALVAGGTIRVADGTYTVEDLVIPRALTLEAEGDAAVIRNIAAESSLIIDGASEGTVIVRGLRFENTSPGDGVGEAAKKTSPDLRTTFSVRIEGSFADVLVDDASFTAAADANGGIRIGASTVGTALATIRNSDFSGGLDGVISVDVEDHPELGARVVVEGGSFRDVRTAVGFEGNSGEIRDVNFQSCIFCIWVEPGYNVGEREAARTIEVSENIFLDCSLVCSSVVGYDAQIMQNNFLMAPGSDGPSVTLQLVHEAGVTRVMTANVEGNRLENCGYSFCIGVFGGVVRPIVTLKGNTLASRTTADAPESGSAPIYGGDATLTIENNTIQRCGSQGLCIFLSGGTATVQGNDIAISETDDVQAVLLSQGGADTRVIDNQIIGSATLTNPDDVNQYAATVGMFAGSAGRIELVGNTVSGVGIAMYVPNGTLTGHGNIFSTLWMAAFTDGMLNMNESDITGTANSFIVTASAMANTSLRCNWWGSAAGPAGIPAGTDEVVYSPWRTGPLAGGAEGACSGSVEAGRAPPVTAVRAQQARTLPELRLPSARTPAVRKDRNR